MPAATSSAADLLDADYDEASESRRLLRTHELGHALGYNHVTARVSIMNPAIGPEPTLFDRQGAIIAFQRPPGNHSPDSDPVATTSAGLGASVPSTAEWSPPIFRVTDPSAMTNLCHGREHRYRVIGSSTIW